MVTCSAAGFQTSTWKRQARRAEGKQDHRGRNIDTCGHPIIADFSVPGKDLHVTKIFFKYTLALGIVFGICVPARALAFHGQPTPEIDPGLAISAITLLAGSLVILRIRRNK
jgi:hypothetical protein